MSNRIFPSRDPLRNYDGQIIVSVVGAHDATVFKWTQKYVDVWKFGDKCVVAVRLVVVVIDIVGGIIELIQKTYLNRVD